MEYIERKKLGTKKKTNWLANLPKKVEDTGHKIKMQTDQLVNGVEF
jgi:hypothetical protein